MAPVPEHQRQSGKSDQHLSQSSHVILLRSLINYSKDPDRNSIFVLKEIKTKHELRDHQEDFRNELRALEKCQFIVQKEKHLITARPPCRVTLSFNTYSLVV